MESDSLYGLACRRLLTLACSYVCRTFVCANGCSSMCAPWLADNRFQVDPAYYSLLVFISLVLILPPLFKIPSVPPAYRLNAHRYRVAFYQKLSPEFGITNVSVTCHRSSTYPIWTFYFLDMLATATVIGGVHCLPNAVCVCVCVTSMMRWLFVQSAPELLLLKKLQDTSCFGTYLW